MTLTRSRDLLTYLESRPLGELGHPERAETFWADLASLPETITATDLVRDPPPAPDVAPVLELGPPISDTTSACSACADEFGCREFTDGC